MKNPEVKKKYSELVTGRKLAYKEDGTRYWTYPEKDGPVILQGGVHTPET